jgi:hypothetical protein
MSKQKTADRAIVIVTFYEAVHDRLEAVTEFAGQASSKPDENRSYELATPIT